jgi:hypothetical protein
VIHIFTRIAIMLALCAATLLLAKHTVNVVTSPFAYSIEPRQGTLAAAGSPAAGLPVAAPTLTAFPQTLARPLFFEGRRFPEPAPQAAQPQQQVEAAPNPPPAAPTVAVETIKLLGVQNDKTGWRALLAVQGQQSEWYVVGQKLEDWEITSIDGNSAQLTSPAGQATLELYPKKSLN